ncbi:hypothetical protein NBRC10512_000154 [Rhodotorula toruloides]|uniref:RHTO0S08e08064g1_1 n=2 Tax=Rhodotorula toruloides TaxID=5286 RepID=A0A061BAI9_RHOTO|nr:uncharacterized protein RHTO_00903 [Rhodotorula toruloides NP11]EMS22149.1 hypothetical protein RHTO_00903 [Rhodotorula toruloides NP11]CDR43928.1 RHTO0S08e08064g1_1 [Rhodotorula toruloides]
MQPSVADRLAAPTSALLDLPQPVWAIERQVRRGIARLEEYALLKPLSFVLSVVLRLIDYLFLLAVLPYCVYKLWRLTEFDFALAVFSSAVTTFCPSIRKLSATQLGERLFGPLFVEQGRLDSAISKVLSSLDCYTRKDRKLEQHKHLRFVELQTNYSADAHDDVLGNMEDFAAAVSAVSALSHERQSQMASTLRFEAESERAPMMNGAQAEERDYSFRLRMLLFQAMICLYDAARLRIEQTKLCRQIEYLSLKLGYVIHRILAFGATHPPSVNLFNQYLLAEHGQRFNAAIYADRDDECADGSTDYTAKMTDMALDSLTAIASVPPTQPWWHPSLASFCGGYMALHKAQLDVIKAEEALFNSILAAILTRKDFKRTMTEWKSARSS